MSIFIGYYFSVGPYVGAQVSFRYNGYSARESDGRVAIIIVAYRHKYFYKSFSVKIKSSVDTRLKSYGIAKYNTLLT